MLHCCMKDYITTSKPKDHTTMSFLRFRGSTISSSNPDARTLIDFYSKNFYDIRQPRRMLKRIFDINTPEIILLGGRSGASGSYGMLRHLSQKAANVVNG